MRIVGAIAALVITGFAGLAMAEETAPPASPVPGPADNSAVPETQSLTCIANGQAYQAGEIACVPACHGQTHLARCESGTQASAGWKTISDSCPSVRATPLPPGNPAYPSVLICTLMNNAPFAQIQ